MDVQNIGNDPENKGNQSDRGATLRADEQRTIISTGDGSATLHADDGPGTNWQTGNIPGGGNPGDR